MQATRHAAGSRSPIIGLRRLSRRTRIAPVFARAALCLAAAWFATAHAGKAETRVGGAAQTWPILHHTIEADVDPSTARLAVTDHVRLAAPPDPAAPLYLLLNRSLAVESAVLRGTPLRVDSSEGFQPRRFWDRPDYERMKDYAIAREVTVHPPAGGWPADPEITLTYGGAVYDSLRPPEVAYGRSFETTAGLIDPRGAFLAGSTFWIPWSGEDLFRFRLRARVPAGWESVSQGTWASRRVLDDGRIESLWVVEDPMNEAYLVAGPWTVREQQFDEVTAYTFTYADTPEDLCATYLDATGRYLDLYEEMIGPYPFDKFALVENWWQTGFGMPSFTLLGDRVIRLPFIVHTSYGHEILHNWWGNGVFVDADGGNWCEGLTSYLADYLYKARENAAAARDYRLSQLRGYLDYAGSGSHDFALRRFTERESPSTQAVGYGKTMMVFFMTQNRLGHDDFFDGLKRLYRERLFREATWDDVAASFEAVSGRNLDGWFAQWLDRPGAPSLSVARVPGSGGPPAIEVRQEEPFYDLSVPVRYAVEGEIRTTSVALNGASARLHLEEGAEWVAVDPDFEIFRRLHRAEIPPTLSQVLGADSTIVVIGSRCPPDAASALRDLAAEWSRNHDQVLVDEAAFRGHGGRGVWLFGEGDLVDRLVAESRSFGNAPAALRDEARRAGRTAVLCFRDPVREDVPWTAVLPAKAADVAPLGRKLPHYGGYGYLVFDGETNVDKGSWTVESSPLRIALTEE